MLVQGASLVRLVNALLAENGEGRSFVLMAVYFEGVHYWRSLLYQMECQGKEVWS